MPYGLTIKGDTGDMVLALRCVATLRWVGRSKTLLMVR